MTKMIRSRVAPLVLSGVCAALLTACGSTAKPDQKLDNDHLAHEYAQAVYNTQLGNAASGVDTATKAAVSAADANCSALKTAKNDGLLTLKGDGPTDADAIRGLITGLRNTGLTSEQALTAITVSAKYKCSEFNSALELYQAIHGYN
ncbi:hypothetical protein ACQP1O_42780 (plasmid) [Nocardia sp. CA-151230]|uniref:hypothetical protein n=1 Tax=Nocardia sp. CA-151230 TaxID=3239982 RepID=UPI003D8A14E4